MPSLADTLQRISDGSEQIEYHSSLNARPAGPFVQQYLYLTSNNSAGVFDLIRDAADSEVRLFKFIGESEPNAAGGGNKRVEKREGVLVTPLKEYKKDRARGKDDVDVMLRTAAKLIDDYRPMPRLRAHISNLMTTHNQQLEYIAALEAQIAEAQNPQAPSKKARTSLAAPAKPVLSVDDAVKAEEESIRALEASLQLLREATAPPPTEPEPEPQPELSTPVSATPARAPLSPVSPSTISAQARAALRQSQLAQTPARPMPNVTNSLVTGMTPHRSARKTIDRFSPLRLLQTPRSAVKQSGLRYSVPDDEEGPRTIFARRSSARTPSGQIIDEGGEDETMAAVEDEMGMDEDEDAEEEENGVEDEGEEEYYEEEPKQEMEPDSLIREVNIDVDSIHSVTAKIWATVPEMMTQGLPEGITVGQDPSDTIEHIHRLAQSDPAPPPSPSDSSSVAVTTSKAPPVNSQTILIAQLLLSVLRTISPAEPQGGVRMADLKERLIGIAQVRGWEGADPAVTKAIYAAVGRKVVKIDRRDGAGGTVRIAE